MFNSSLAKTNLRHPTSTVRACVAEFASSRPAYLDPSRDSSENISLIIDKGLHRRSRRRLRDGLQTSFRNIIVFPDQIPVVKNVPNYDHIRLRQSIFGKLCRLENELDRLGVAVRRSPRRLVKPGED